MWYNISSVNTWQAFSIGYFPSAFPQKVGYSGRNYFQEIGVLIVSFVPVNRFDCDFRSVRVTLHKNRLDNYPLPWAWRQLAAGIEVAK